MADNKYTSLADDQKASLREREALMRRKAMAGAPQAAPVPKPYAPPLTVDEITRKFMGGPAVQPTGIPQQSAQNPARPAPAAPAAAPAPQAEPMMRPDQSDRLSAQRARVSAGATQRDYKRAYDSGAGADELNRIGQNMDDYRRIDAGYQARQSGAPGPAFTPERVEAGRARLQEQAARIAAERNGQPLPGDTDTWSYEAGQRALPPELRGQKFTSPQDQANYRDFSRFAGGAPSIDPATGMMTTPADREYQNVQQMREQEQLARRKMSQPIEFAPFDPAEAQRNQAAATEHYNSILSRADAARGRVAGREGEYRTAAEGPTTTAAATARAQLAEAERLRARSQSDTRMIPSQETAGIAENQAKATDANYRTVNAGTMSLRDQAKYQEEAARANAAGGAAQRRTDAEIRGLEANAGLAEAQAGYQRAGIDRAMKPGGAMDTQQRGADAASSAEADRRVSDAAAAKYGSVGKMVEDADKFMGNMKRRSSASLPFGLSDGKVDMNITGPSAAEDINDLSVFDRGVVRNLEGYAAMSPTEAARAANEILYKMPTPGSDDLYSTYPTALPSLRRYVDSLNGLRKRLRKIADGGR